MVKNRRLAGLFFVLFLLWALIPATVHAGPGAPPATWGTCEMGRTAPATVWYFADGKTNGATNETFFVVYNPGTVDAAVNFTFLTGAGSVPGPNFTVHSHERKSINAADTLLTSEFATTIAADQPILAQRDMYGDNETWMHDWMGTSTLQQTWYFSEGSTAWGFTEYLTIGNPNGTSTDVDIIYLTPLGPIRQPTFTVPANSCYRVNVNAVLPNQDGSAWVVATKPVCAERSMYATLVSGKIGYSNGGSLPAHDWYFAEGSSVAGNETWIYVWNNNADQANCVFSYFVEGEGQVDVAHIIPADTRVSVSMASDIGEKKAALKVTSGSEILVERVMCGNDRSWSHSVYGANASSTDWYLAYRCTDGGCQSYVELMNPNDASVSANITYYTATGPYTQAVTMDPHSRRTVNTGVFLPSEEFTIHVTASGNIVAESSMYNGTPAPSPTVTSITPNSATQGSTVGITNLAGANFQNGATVKLKKGSSEIAGGEVAFISSSQLICSFNLDGAEDGLWDVVVTNPDAGLGTLAGGFTVNVKSPVVMSVDPEYGPPGTQVTITGSGFGSSRGAGKGKSGKGASYVSFNGVAATEYPKWTDTEIVCVVPQGATPGPVVVVTSAGSSSTDKTFTVSYPTWYLAEGSTDWGYDCYITIENPNTTSVTVKLTYQTKSGEVSGPQFAMAASSQATVNPRDKVGNTDFSTKVECLEGLTIAADRTMTWTGPGAPSPEAHNSVGVTSPERTWYLAEGSSAWGFECWLLIQNPNNQEATCAVTYMIEGSGPQTVVKKVPASSRATFDMSKDIGAKDASIKVTSDVPVIPERAMYRNNRREGHDSIGTTTPASDYYLAEGATGYNVGYITYVLVQNPNDTPTDVTLTYMTQSGQVPGPSFQMSANSRKTIRVNDQLPPNTDVSTSAHGSQPIIAERAMYWDNGTGEACHDSIGMDQPHTSFFLPDGQSSEGRETWTLVQNPNAEAVTVDISYLTPNGQGNVTWNETIGAKSRRTFNMADKGINGRAAIMVTSKTSGKKIMVERAMYWNSRGAGTDTIGGYSD